MISKENGHRTAWTAIPRADSQNQANRKTLVQRHLQRMDGRDRRENNGKIRNDIEHGVGSSDVLKATQCVGFSRRAWAACDNRQGEGVGNDADANGDDGELVYARRVDAIENCEYGHFCDGGSDQVRQSVRKEDFVELHQVAQRKLPDMPAPSYSHHCRDVLAVLILFSGYPRCSTYILSR